MKHLTKILAVLAVAAVFVVGAMALNAAEIDSTDNDAVSSVGPLAAGCGDCPHKKAKAEGKTAKGDCAKDRAAGTACVQDCTCNDDGTCTCADGGQCDCANCACAGCPHAKAGECNKDCPNCKDGKCTCEGCPHAKGDKGCTCKGDGSCTCADGTECTCENCACEGCPKAKAEGAHKGCPHKAKAKAKGERPCPHSGG